MYRVFAVASDIRRIGPGPLDTLRRQLDYVAASNVHVELLLDPEPATFEHRLRSKRPQCVYMLPLRRPGCEAEDDNIFAYHTRLTRLLQHLGIAFIGQDYQSQLTLDDKMLAASLSGMHPPGWLLTRSAMLRDQGRESIGSVPLQEYPVIVKPNTLWASQGLGPESVCGAPGQIAAQAARLFERFPGLDEIRIEKYLSAAREFTVTVLGNNGRLLTAVTALVHSGSAHMIFSEAEKTAKRERRVLSYAPVIPESPEHSPLRALALQLFERFSFRDIARFDVLWADDLYVIDVNHMPSLGHAICCSWTDTYGLQVNQLLALLLVAFDQRRVGSTFDARRLPKAVAASLPPTMVKALIDDQRASS